MGKTVAEARDVPGFLANRMLLPMLNEAAFCLYEGVGDAEAIDTVMRLGMNHPLGPLALADLIGLDTCLAILEVLHHGFGDPKFRPCPLWRQYVEAGRLGRKTGRGFHAYPRFGLHERVWPGFRSTRAGSRCGERLQPQRATRGSGDCRLVVLVVRAHQVPGGCRPGGPGRGPWVASSWRGPAFLPALAGRRPAGPYPRRGARILVASAGGMTAYHLALNEGERTTASGVAALIVALAPAATLALAVAVGLERFASRRIAGIALAFAGVVVVVVLGSGAEFSLHGLRGPLLVLVAPLTFALYNVLYKPLLGRYDLPALTAAGGLVGSLLFLPFENSGAIERFGGLERATGSRWSHSGSARRSAARDGASRCGVSSRRVRCPIYCCRPWPWRSARCSWTSP